MSEEQQSAPTPAPPSPPGDGDNQDAPPKRWPFLSFLSLLAFDALGSILLMLSTLPWIARYGGATKGYTLGCSLLDLLILMGLRIVTALLGFLISYSKGEIRPRHPFPLYHNNGVKKSREELEEEALEQNFFTWFIRYTSRPSFPCEIIALITTLLCIVKSLVRMNVEMGRYADAEPVHPIFWLAMAFAGVVSVLESAFVDSICQLLGEIGHREEQGGSVSFMRRIGSNMSLSLLANDSLQPQSDVEQATDASTATSDEHAPAVSDIGADANYSATLSDLAEICLPDLPLLCFAFIFLLLAATAQVYIPRFTGNILDVLAESFSGDNDDDARKHDSIGDIPGFKSNVINLIVASVLGGIFSGFRGSIFTVVGGKVNVRLRMRLMDSLLVQDVGFFDTTKIGDITSRLSSDTTLVGDQVTLNVNVFLRSLVQAIGVLIFMFVVSWQLSILAFISVPAITVMSKWYGNFIRSLTKVMQKKLADGNAVSEAALSSMSTVHAFDAGSTEFNEFGECLEKYLNLNFKSSVAYCGYATCVTSLPQLVTALVVFYGGLMVRNGDLSSGELVSFLLYLQSLSDAFASIGYIFSSLTQAVGAADKVFELMRRKPRIKNSTMPPPSNTGDVPRINRRLGMTATKTGDRRLVGIEPETCRGEIVLRNVDMFYPARPQRQILHGMTLTVPPGKIAALVGQSGGGKSSVISLVQHLYQQSAGKVMIDGNEVHELSPRWLSQHVSVVSQEPTLFGRSIKRNIIYGLEGTDLEPSDEDIVRVAKLANADSFIEKLPMKYETEVGERGVQLSGGQKQRIAIARALVRKPKVLLLDEATSALDAESEHMVQEAIDQMLAAGREQGSEGMTVIVVAHRLSTIRNADIIFVVQDGKVVEQGSHSELLEIPDGSYNALISRQMSVQKKLESPDAVREEASKLVDDIDTNVSTE